MTVYRLNNLIRNNKFIQNIVNLEVYFYYEKYIYKFKNNQILDFIIK